MTEAVGAPERSSGREPHVVYVLTDPGVPAYGHKGASVHVQSVLREVCRTAGPQVSLSLVSVRLGGPVPRGLERVEAVELGRPGAREPAELERALVHLDEAAAAAVVERVRALHAADPGRDVVVYQRYALWSGRVLERAREAGAITVLELNAPLIPEQKTHRVLVDEPAAVAWTRRAIGAAHVPFAVSTPVARWAADLAQVAVGVVPNGVDVSRFTPSGSARDRSHPTGSARTPVIVFAGTFRPWHGTELLVEAVGRLHAHGLEARLLLVGDGPRLSQLRRQAEDLGIEVTATGAVPQSAVPGLLAASDLACAPYPEADAYFSPLKVFEYLAAGLPTVCAGIGDLPRLLGPDEVLLVPPGDVDALALALGRLLRDAPLRERLAAAGRRAAVERFGWDAVVARVLTAASARSVDSLTPATPPRRFVEVPG